MDCSKTQNRLKGLAADGFVVLVLIGSRSLLRLICPFLFTGGALSATYVIDPIVLTKDPKPLSHSFVERIPSHLDGILAPAQVGARDAACAKRHMRDASRSAFYSPR
jgi:hypothetical protein